MWPRAAWYAPIYFFPLYDSISTASPAFLSPLFASSITSLLSIYFPVIPSNPLFLLRMMLISPGDNPNFSIIYRSIAASWSPERVPITAPSSGVNPILVSTETPFFTALKLTPFPRCAIMRFVSKGFFPRRTEALFAVYRNEVP
ncbi:hypothetical protein ES703_54245 [subsurface metagenome]